MDEETKKAIMETQGLLAEILAVQKEQLQLMRDQAALAKAAVERGANPEMVMKNIISSLPPGLQKAMNSFSPGCKG